MKIIFKYPLEVKDSQIIETHKYSQILTVQMQNGTPCLWLLIDDEQPLTKLIVTIFGTGWTIPSNFFVGDEHNTYAGTIQQSAFVWHVFVKNI